MPTWIGFRRKIIKLSALCIIKRVNLWHSMRSISSACLILMLSLIELIEGSIKTRSFSLRDIVRGFSRTSLDPLERDSMGQPEKKLCWIGRLPCLYFGFIVSFYNLQDINGGHAQQGMKYLGREVFQSESSGQGRSDGSQVWAQRVRLARCLT